MMLGNILFEAHIEYDNIHVPNRFVKNDVIGLDKIIEEYKRWAFPPKTHIDYGCRKNFEVVFTERSLKSIKEAMNNVY